LTESCLLPYKYNPESSQVFPFPGLTLYINNLRSTLFCTLYSCTLYFLFCTLYNKTLGLIKRISRGITDFATRRSLYCTIVRPKLEYASNVWSPSATIIHRSLIENVQRRATKFILNYPKEMTYTERLITTNLLPLQFRREITDLMLLNKSKTELIPMDVNNFLCSYEPGFRSPNYNENNYYFLLKHKQQYFRNSFFVRSASLWNSLPADPKICGSLHSFKISIRKHYVSKLTSYSPPGFT
jgi:hypothetical protein